MKITVQKYKFTQVIYTKFLPSNITSEMFDILENIAQVNLYEVLKFVSPKVWENNLWYAFVCVWAPHEKLALYHILP